MKLAFVLVFVILIAGCTSAVNQGTPVSETSATPAAPADVELRIMNNAFAPSAITVRQGATVTWTNEDSVAHTVVSDSFESPSLAKGQTFSHTFDTAGTFTYHCSIHPNMTGTVTVVGN
ncbi:MAG: cupredoxin domain-containing protein [Candidatus Woesearchaeota archaeon]